MQRVENLRLTSFHFGSKTATFDWDKTPVQADEQALTGGFFMLGDFEFQRNLLVARDFKAEIFENNGRWQARRVWVLPDPPEETVPFENFALRLHKPGKLGNNEAALFSLKAKTKKVDGEDRKAFEIQKLSARFSPGGDMNGFRFDSIFLENLNKRQRTNARELLGDAQLLEPLDFAPDWRVVVGLGEASVYETNITLHHVYGIPYLPASAIKGILHHYAAAQLGEQHEWVQDVFGAGDRDTADGRPRKGKIVVFDAFPTQAPRMECDVMTPHYGDYYMKKDVWPADWLMPTPIPFLTVGGGTPFRFNIGIKGENPEPLKAIIKDWLVNALSESGIGAKTAVGYGYFNQ